MSDFDHEEGVVVARNSRYKVDRKGRIWDTKDDVPVATRVSRGASGYLSVQLCGSPQAVRVHLLVADAFLPPRPLGPPRYELDHINMDSADPRMENLRWATRSQNMANRLGWTRKRMHQLPKNVFPTGQRFAVRIVKDRVEHRIGTYSTVAEAEIVAKRERLRLFGEFARDM